MPETSNPVPRTIDTRLCPLCGKSNLCANEAERATGIPQGSCWCTTATFDTELLARIPTEARRRACVCARCASGARADTTTPSTN